MASVLSLFDSLNISLAESDLMKKTKSCEKTYFWIRYPDGSRHFHFLEWNESMKSLYFWTLEATHQYLDDTYELLEKVSIPWNRNQKKGKPK